CGVAIGVGVEQRAARGAAQPVPLAVVIAVETSGLGVGLDDRGAGHHWAFGHLGVGGLSDGVGARRVAAAAAARRGVGQVQVFVCSHQGFPSCCVMTVV